MAPRPIEKELSAQLRDNQFRFMNIHGETSLSEIYEAVKARYDELCDDTYPCPHERARVCQPEWKHTVRSVLNLLKKKGVIDKSAQYTKWIFY